MTTRVRSLIVTSFTAGLFIIFLSGALNLSLVSDTLGISNQIGTNLLAALIISIVLALGTSWVLFFKSKQKSIFVLSLFPAIAILPYVLLADSVIKSIFSNLGQLSVSIIAAAIYWLVTYLLILTANVLNGALLFNIPLGQAGKAAQFIFSLISSYFLIAFLFGGAFSIEVRLLIISLFVFYFSYACIYVLQLPMKEIWMSSLVITLVMGVITVLLSVWPIASVYATLVAVVFFYIMLNVALEVREKIGNAIWVEYAVLLVLVAVILFTNGNWGINGRLL